MTAKEQVILAARDVEPGQFVGRITAGGYAVEEETVRRGQFDNSDEPELVADPELQVFTVGDEHDDGALAIAYKDTGEDGLARAAIEQRVHADNGLNPELLRAAVTFAMGYRVHTLDVVATTNVPESVLAEAGFKPQDSGGYEFTVPRPPFIAPAAAAA